MSRKLISDIESKGLRNIAIMISQKRNIRLMFSDSENSYTDGKKITLSKSSENDLKIAQGLTSHEAGHIGYGSFKNIIQMIQKDLSKEFGFSEYYAHNVVNAIEDCRIDGITHRVFPGFWKNLNEYYLRIISKNREKMEADLLMSIYLYLDEMSGYEEFKNNFSLNNYELKTLEKAKKLLQIESSPIITPMICRMISKIIKSHSGESDASLSLVKLDDSSITPETKEDKELSKSIIKIIDKMKDIEEEEDIDKIIDELIKEHEEEPEEEFEEESEEDSDNEEKEKKRIDKLLDELLDEETEEEKTEEEKTEEEKTEELDDELIKEHEEEPEEEFEEESEEDSDNEEKEKKRIDKLLDELLDEETEEEKTEEEKTEEEKTEEEKTEELDDELLDIIDYIEETEEIMEDKLRKIKDSEDSEFFEYKPREVKEIKISKFIMSSGTIRYDEIIKKNKRTIMMMKNYFSKLIQTSSSERFHKIGRLNNTMIRTVTSDYNFKRCFTKKVMNKMPKLCLMVDISGSMRSNKMDLAKTAAIVLYESVKDICNLKITLFTGTRNALNIIVKDYDENVTKEDLDLIALHRSQRQNVDGESVLCEANHLNDKNSMIIVISDGQPCAKEYDIKDAIPCFELAKKKVKKIFAFSVDARGGYLKLLYGEGNYIYIDSHKHEELTIKLIKFSKIVLREML